VSVGALFTRLGRRLQYEWRCLIRPVIEVHGLRVRLGRHLSRRVEGALRDGSYEKAELKLLKSVLEPEDVVLEVGAGLGFISTFCARRLGSERVFTYEANPELERPIRETYRLNAVGPTLTMAVIGSEDGEAVFYRDKHLWSSSVVLRSPNMRPVRVARRSLTVEAARYRPTLLIVDAEGAEGEMFQGAKLPTVTRILVELHERVIGADGVARARADLAALGFVEDATLSRGEQLVLRRRGAPVL
jgi:FkbM family methyltransferase